MDKKTFTKYCLAKALFDLLEEKEFADISIQGIVDKAGFSRMAYYRNFKSISEIIDFSLHDYIDNFIKNSRVFSDKLGPKQFFTLIFEYLGKLETRRFFNILFKRDLIIHLYRQFILSFLTHAQEKDLYLKQFVGGGIFSVYGLWARNGYKESPEDMGEKIMKILSIKD